MTVPAKSTRMVSVKVRQRIVEKALKRLELGHDPGVVIDGAVLDTAAALDGTSWNDEVTPVDEDAAARARDSEITQRIGRPRK